MKQLLLSLLLLLCVGNMYGQTVEKLIKKYKALPHAEYAETTEQIRAGIPMEKNEALDLSAEDYEFIRKNFKKAEQLQLALDDDQKAELDKDLEALKGYELLYTQNDNTEPEESKNPVQNMINQTYNPDYQLRIYGRHDELHIMPVADIDDRVYIIIVLGYPGYLLPHVGKIKRRRQIPGIHGDLGSLYTEPVPGCLEADHQLHPVPG